jgi:hypothetical protein
MVTVVVFWKSTGDPASDRRVSIGVNNGLWGSGVTKEQFTDSRGEAHFDIRSSRGEVFVDHKSMHKGQVGGRIVVYI